MLEEYYRILELNPGATRQEIKRAYWRLAKQWHPDVNPTEEAAVRFVRIHQAYEMLMKGEYASVTYGYSSDRDGDDVLERVYWQQKYWEAYWVEKMRRVEAERLYRQQRAAHFARMQYEEFKKNNEIFKSSFWYIPAILFTYFAWAVGNLAGVCCLFFPIWVAFFIGNIGAGLTLFPFSLLGFAVIAAAFRFKKDVERYF